MTTTLPEPTLQALRAYLLANLGLSYSKNQGKDLVRKIEYAAKEFGYSNPAWFGDWLLHNKLTDQQTSALASHLTIGETYFMREKKGFDFLEQIYLPGLIHKRYGADKRLRVWCAGCATGEEAYSLAIVLLQSIPNIQHWDISILATDINSVFLEKAKKGIYAKWSFRNNSKEFINRYFIKEGNNKFRIRPRIQKMVKFAPLNLAEENYPSLTNQTEGIDIIFCRNVLIYFSPEGIRGVTDRLFQSLVKGGIMVVSPVEMSGMISPKLSRFTYAGFTIYQKGALESKEKQPLWPLPEPQAILPALLSALKEKPIIREDGQSELNRLKQLLPEKKGQPPPQLKEHEFEQALLLFNQGSFEEAETLLSGLEKKEALNGKPVISLLAKTKANLGKLNEAEELCDKALQLDKLDPGLNYLLATIKQEQGDDKKVIFMLNRALYLDPNFILAHFLLGTQHLKAGNHSSGKKHFRNAVKCLSKLDPDEILPESDGLTAKSFNEILTSIKS